MTNWLERPTRNRSGFTLLELMMVIVIAGLTLAIGVTGLARAQYRIRVDRAASVLSDDIQSAFALVGRDRKPVRVVWDASKTRFLLTDRAMTSIFRIRPMGLDTEYKLAASAFVVSDTAFEIYPPGLAENALTITITNGNAVPRTITISRAGLVSISNQK
ncbi:MAG: prepilin-type N-terminal cleavage/methylation domain-containing protein [Gemmatimonadota bacterium]